MAKTNWSNIILFIIAGGIVAKLYLDSYTGKLKFGKVVIGFEGISLKGVTLNLTIPITNNNSEAATISAFKGSVFYGNGKLADLIQINPVTIVANGTTNYQIQAKVLYKDIASDIKADIATGNYIQQFSIQGNLTVGQITVPINEPVTVLF